MHAKVKPAPDLRAGARESTRPIRALNRGLKVLAALNRLERAPINVLADAAGLPRTTTFRILETLRLDGYLERDPHDDCYRPTVRVRALARGFGDEAMLAHLAKAQLPALGAELVWPVAIATRTGTDMQIRESTDHHSPLALEQFGAGVRIPMLASAAGRIYLAHCAEDERDALLEALASSPRPEDRPARNRPQLLQLLQETKAQGYGVAQRARRVSEETSLAIPVQAHGRVLAALSVRFASTAVPLATAADRFLPKMRALASNIEREFIRQTGESAVSAAASQDAAA